jgi:hypothetical protein
LIDEHEQNRPLDEPPASGTPLDEPPPASGTPLDEPPASGGGQR